MNAVRTKGGLLPAVAMLLLGLAASARAQVTCNASVSVPVLARTDGYTEPLGDLLLSCTGGIPTAAGSLVPQVNFTVILNTNVTSHVTQGKPSIDFSEALLLVDEPNSLVNPPQRPLLNCGHDGAPDNGISGPGVCSTVSDGTPADTYDGTKNFVAGVPCDGIGSDPAPNTYGCGRPNTFQGRMGSADNVVEFLGVPFDPPGGGTRIFRFTNLRANASVFGSGGPFPINVDIAVTTNLSITINNPVQTVAYAQTGMAASIGSPNVVHVAENFATAWKARNVAFTLANATFGGGGYTYSGGTAYPPEAAQNVPGTIYNTEDMFQWQNNGVNAPPIPNPPAGYSGGPVANLGDPLSSALAFGGVDTKIDKAGVARFGTRIALTFTHVPGHGSVTVPSVVYLYRTTMPLVNSGVMVLTTTNAAGAGPFTPGASTTIPDGGTAVYEILYADPFTIEAADIMCTVPGKSTQVAVSFAPFYSTAGARFATPTAAHPKPVPFPRFIPASGTLNLSK